MGPREVAILFKGGKMSSEGQFHTGFQAGGLIVKVHSIWDLLKGAFLVGRGLLAMNVKTAGFLGGAKKTIEIRTEG